MQKLNTHYRILPFRIIKAILVTVFVVARLNSFSQKSQVILAPSAQLSAVVYQPEITNVTIANRAVNTALPVGVIAGEANVSNVGAAEYNVQLFTPPGTNGMVPSLSLNYNSQSGDGLLGLGWSFSGLSAISRSNKDKYFDNTIEPIKLSINDVYILDGQRMIKQPGPSGPNAAMYKTETIDYSLITAYNVLGNGPAYFEMITKEGKKIEFGNSINARSLDNASASVIIWRMNKVTDQSGNYMEFIYDPSFETRISEIKYTGNATSGILPYNTLKFFYGERSDKITQYFAGKDLYKGLLLEKIEMYTEGNVLTKSYELKYTYNSEVSRLNEIIEKGGDGSQLNSTIFKYGESALNNLQNIVVQNNDFFTCSEFISSDYNNDGAEELNAFKLNKQIISGVISSIYTTTNQFSNFGIGINFNTNHDQVIVNPSILDNNLNFSNCDFDGDGKTEIVYYNSINLKTFLNFSTNSRINLTNRSNGKKYNHLFGDFNGDKATDVIYNFLGVNLWSISLPFLSSLDNDVTNNSNPPALTDLSKSTVMDFNGDGKDDIVFFKTNGFIDVFSVEGNPSSGYTWSSIASGYFSTLGDDYFGDFNGDGKGDVLHFNSGNAQIAYSNGTGLPAASTATAFALACTSSDKIIAADFNGDGKCDIFIARTNGSCTIKQNNGDNTFFDYNFTCVSFASISDINFVVLDANGDGKKDLFIRHKSNSISGDLYLFRANDKQHLLEKVCDGFNNVTEFTYNRLNDGNGNYTVGTSSIYPLADINSSMPIVSKLTKNVGNNPIITDYKYTEGITDKKVRGFVGFKKMEMVNLAFGTRMENFYALHPINSMPYLSIQRRYVNNSITPTSEETYSYNVLQSGLLFKKDLSALTKVDFLTGTTIYTYYTYDAFSNPTSTNKGYFKSTSPNLASFENVTTTNTYSLNSISGLPSNLLTTNTTFNKVGKPSISKNTNYTYDVKNRLLSKTMFPSTSNAFTMTYAYNNFGNLLSETTTSSGLSTGIIQYTYDVKGRFPATKTTSSIPASAATTIVETYVNDAKFGNLLTYKTSDCNTITYEYDAFGKLKKTNFLSNGFSVTNNYLWSSSTPSGTNSTSLFYIHESHPGKPDIKKHFNKIGQEIAKETETFGVNQWTISTVKYDFKGNKIETSKPILPSETYTAETISYDNFDRPIQYVNPSRTGNLSYSYSNFNRVTTMNYDLPLKTKITTVDITGKTLRIDDITGILEYDYDSEGRVLSSSANGSVITTNVFNPFGQHIQMIDKNAGSTSYAYNAYNQLLSSTDANNKVTTFTYDNLGRMLTKTMLEGITSYQYFYTNSGTACVNNNISKIIGYNGVITDNLYDALNRLISKTETVDGIANTTTYTYDIYNNLKSVTYPSGVGVNYNYDANGFITSIKNKLNTINLFVANIYDGLGRLKSYTLGNGKTTINTYNNDFLSSTITPNIQNLSYNIDLQNNGRIISKTDALKGLTDTYTYDLYDRLTSAQVNGQPAITTAYSQNGNITSKTGIGNYQYDVNKSNALNLIPSPNAAISQNQQDITYNSMNKATLISENTKDLFFIYGNDENRVKSQLKQGTQILNTRYYFGNYEKDILPASTKEIHYVSSPAGIISMIVKESGVENYYYVYKDHLGSILTITNQSATILAEQNFDAWGRRRNPNNFTYNAIPTNPAWLYRGFTGHEHIFNNDLINMNGRIYDPLVSRMLSADNFIQQAGSLQNYNRYSYVMNNPVNYTDPDGQWVVFAFLFFTKPGYEVQKFLSPAAFHVNIHLNREKRGLGFDASFGVPKVLPLSYRRSIGATYYWAQYDNSFKGWEKRSGGEWTIGGIFSVEGTNYKSGSTSQTTTTLTIGGPIINLQYENDYMYDLNLPLIPHADGGDRYRTAALRYNSGFASIGFNLFTGDPGLDPSTKKKENRNGQLYYVPNDNGDDPNQYRSGVLSFGFGPFQIGRNSEAIRDRIQNKIVHNAVHVPYFTVDKTRKPRNYFYAGTGGSSLW